MVLAGSIDRGTVEATLVARWGAELGERIDPIHPRESPVGWTQVAVRS